MESTHDVLDNSGAVSQELTLSPNAISFLHETRKWVNFMAILGFIGIGLMVIFGLFAGTIFGAMASEMGTPAAGFSGFFGIFYIFVALLYFFPVMYLYKFGSKLKIALNSHDNGALEGAFENLKSHYKFVGILMIIVMSFYVLAAIFMAIAGFSAMSAFG
ncbi:DUF5362 domain-containing protein [Cryomorpha ignava]|uniref:DUF5362 domain-containing protein n=1 Tax=Cryomorpha ignava TaxID=101383 RepID=A0A7K3WUT1_9FLAO|nr:DUF5362 family protein [Cryomorpha ignava]NEN25298.1 DUF5362 domain-containing protein [Cryomorpha ignava]